MNRIVGIRAHDLGCLPPRGLAAAVRSCGLAGVQLSLPKAIRWDGDGVSLTPQTADALRNAMDGYDLRISVLSCYINPSIPDPTLRAGELAKFESYLAFAPRVGADLVGTETGSFLADCGDHPWNHGEEAFALCAQSMRQLARAAAACGVRIGIEPVVRHVIDSPERLDRLLDEVGREHIRIIFDPVNLLTPENHTTQRAMMDTMLRLFGDAVAVIHLKDFRVVDGAMVPVRLGTGFLDMPYLAALFPNADLILDEVRKEDVPEIMQYLQACGIA